jgi:hypothetical protein
MLERLILGDTLSFLTTVADYPASAGWVLAYRLVPRGAGSAITITCTASGEQHRAQVAAGATAAWAAGTYSWHSYVTKAAESYSVATGSIQLLANPRTTTSGLDLRTNAQIALDAVQATLSGKATSGTSSYRIGERELRSYTITELIQLESKLKADVAREINAARIAAGQPSNRQIHVRMGRA